jgi:hypothetical protein
MLGAIDPIGYMVLLGLFCSFCSVRCRYREEHQHYGHRGEQRQWQGCVL